MQEVAETWYRITCFIVHLNQGPWSLPLTHDIWNMGLDAVSLVRKVKFLIHLDFLVSQDAFYEDGWYDRITDLVEELWILDKKTKLHVEVTGSARSFLNRGDVRDHIHHLKPIMRTLVRMSLMGYCITAEFRREGFPGITADPDDWVPAYRDAMWTEGPVRPREEW